MCHVGIMLERTNRGTGNKFVGCSEWPKCKCTGEVLKDSPPVYSGMDLAEIVMDEAEPYPLTPGERRALKLPPEIAALVEEVPPGPLLTPMDVETAEPPKLDPTQDLLLHMVRVIEELEARLNLAEQQIGVLAHSQSQETPSTGILAQAAGILTTAAPPASPPTLPFHPMGYCVGPHDQADICSPFEPHLKRANCVGWHPCTELDMRRVVESVERGPKH